MFRQKTICSKSAHSLSRLSLKILHLIEFLPLADLGHQKPSSQSITKSTQIPLATSFLFN
jgi:hypothetical protein